MPARQEESIVYARANAQMMPYLLIIYSGDDYSWILRYKPSGQLLQLTLHP